MKLHLPHFLHCVLLACRANVISISIAMGAVCFALPAHAETIDMNNETQPNFQEDAVVIPAQEDMLSGTDGALILAVHNGEQSMNSLKGSGHRAYEKACDIVKAVKAKSQKDYDVALELYKSLIANGKRITNSSQNEPVATVLIGKKGRGEDYAYAYYTLCNMAGVECRVVHGTADGQEHVWNMVRLDGCWAHVDCTQGIPRKGEKKKKGRKGDVYYDYFGASDDVMSPSYTWNREDHPPCTERKFWHVWHNAPQYATVDKLVAMVAKEAKKGDGIAKGYAHVAELENHPKHIDKLIDEAVDKHCEGPRRFRFRYKRRGSLLYFRVEFK